MNPFRYLLAAVLLIVGGTALFGCGGNSTRDNRNDGSTADASTDAPTSDGADGADGSVTEMKWEFGSPIEANPGQWTWVEFPGTRCMRSNKPVGIAINPAPADSPNADKVHIWMEGGGACFNNTTCNPPELVQLLTGETAFAAHVLGYTEADMAKTIASARNLNRAAAENPFKDWNLVMVPYCSGDIHTGRGATYGNGTYTGYSNMTAYLKRIVPTFPAAEVVILSGSSAGGFGAIFNYEQTQSAFGDVPVHLLQDSSPFVTGSAMTVCAQERIRSVWDLDPILPRECTDCTNPAKGGLSNLHGALMEKYPERRFGLIASTADETIRFFWGETMSECAVPDADETVLAVVPISLRVISPQTFSTA
ncbi:MAG: hypothetical protein KC417_09465, partial [Myxococcales bacterium]|nr:hypothetical protein [Myxococcales bacterium]